MTKSAELIAGKYRLRTKLGEGGMAEVWSAIHVRTGREFAIGPVSTTVDGSGTGGSTQAVTAMYA